MREKKKEKKEREWESERINQRIIKNRCKKEISAMYHKTMKNHHIVMNYYYTKMKSDSNINA